MMEPKEILSGLDALIKTPNELETYLEDNTILLFATPDIPSYYRLLTDINVKKPLPRVILAWMAFLCGDHGALFNRLQDIRENELNDAQTRAMFYSLKALVSSMMDTGEALRCAKLSIDVLPQGDMGFAMANAELTYGQIMAGTNQYRAAAEHFAQSYKIFSSLKLSFLAVVALTNELLNRYRLGEVRAVLDKCDAALLMSGSFKGEMQNYWNLVHLPMGIAYYELGKPNLAAEHLKLAKSCIDSFELFHMHGMIEHHLFLCFLLLHDKTALECLKQETEKQFGHMHFKQMDLLLGMMNIITAEDLGQCQADIENFELEYREDDINPYAIVTDVLFFLRQRGMSGLVTARHLEKRLDHFRFIGNLPRLQTTLIQMTELCLSENRSKDAAVFLKEAVQIYKDCGICAAFFLYPLRSAAMLEKLCPKLGERLEKVQIVQQMEAYLLSERERDIIKLIAQGKTNIEMSMELFISVGTVKWHINHIFSKLEVKNRVQAIERAKTLGEIT